MLACRGIATVSPLGGSRTVTADALPRQPLGSRRRGSGSRSVSGRWQISRVQLPLAPAAAGRSGAEESEPGEAAADELPLWRFLRQQGFSADIVSRLQAAVSSGKARYGIKTCKQFTEQKLQRDLAPNIAALRAEGLDTASIERMFEPYPKLLTTTHETLGSALAALRQLAALLPDNPHAVQAPPGATQLGMALWLYPTAAARLLALANLGSLIDGNLRARRRLGVSDAEAALGLFKDASLLASNFERAEAMVAHLQRLQASGVLSAEQVASLAQSSALKLSPAEFDRRWQEGGLSQASKGSIKSISLKDPAGRQRAAAEALGELLQAADSVPGPLQPQFRQQGEALVQRSSQLWGAGAPALRAGWASLQRLGLSSSQTVAAVQKQPGVLGVNWDGETKQRLLTWVQQELGLSPLELLTRHTRSTSRSVSTLAMRADFMRQHRPAVPLTAGGFG